MTQLEMRREFVRRQLLAERDDLIDLAAELVGIPAPNPPGDTTAVSEYVRDYLTCAGVPFQTYSNCDTKVNIVATVGRLDGPRVVLCAHMDTFPCPSAWDPSDAYLGRVDDGKLYGTAIGDMRAGLAVVLTLGRIFSQYGVDALGGIVLVFTSDEERGGRDGAELVIERSSEVRGASSCIVADQSGVTSIGAAEKGSCWLKISTAAAQGHAAYTEGRGAVAELIAAIQAAENLRTTGPADAAPKGISASEAASRITVNVGTLDGGIATNLAASSAAATVDIRIPFGVRVSDILASIESEFSRGDVQASVEVIRASDPSASEAMEPVVRACVQNATRVTGREAFPEVRIGMSDARLFREAGIPAVVCGPTAHHLADVGEYVEIQEVIEVAQVISDTVVDLLSGNSQ